LAQADGHCIFYQVFGGAWALDHALPFWVIPTAVTAGVIAFAWWRRRLAAAKGTADAPTKPCFAIPDETTPPGVGNARLVLTTSDLAQRSFAEALLRAANIDFTVVEMSLEAAIGTGEAPYYQLTAVREKQAAEARSILRESLTEATGARTIHSARSSGRSCV
jgi:hypothetical protein